MPVAKPRLSVDEIKSLLKGKDVDRAKALQGIRFLPKQTAVRLLTEGLRHWSRPFREACATDLAAYPARSTPGKLIEAAESTRISKASVVVLLRGHECPAAVKYLESMIHLANQDALATLKNYKSNSALLTYWRHTRKFDPALRRKLASVSAKGLKAYVAKIPSNERKHLLAIPNARKYFASRGLESLYADIDAQKEEEEKDQSSTAERKTEDRSLDSLAERLGLHVATLGIFCREWDDVEAHYKLFELDKKDGGVRQLAAPDRSLKTVQRRIQSRILVEQPLHEACHGFRSKHSIITNAQSHVRNQVVVNLDLEDFFPSISAGRVYGIFKEIGCGTFESRFLTRLTTFQNCLPQGAPTSPMLANLAARRLDSRLAGVAKKTGARYSRYADDLTFSGKQEILAALPLVRKIIAEESFKISEKKFRISRPGVRQEVTGLTVNQGVSIPRKFRRQLRAAIHSFQKGKAPHWNGKPMSLAQLKGRVAFLNAVHPELASEYKTILASPRKKKKKK